MPPDVRKVCDLPSDPRWFLGYAQTLRGIAPNDALTRSGRSQTFRTSNGEAVRN